MPVNTMARFNRSATAITSGSRTEPPGWITAVAPAAAAASTPCRPAGSLPWRPRQQRPRRRRGMGKTRRKLPRFLPARIAPSSPQVSRNRHGSFGRRRRPGSRRLLRTRWRWTSRAWKLSTRSASCAFLRVWARASSPCATHSLQSPRGPVVVPTCLRGCASAAARAPVPIRRAAVRASARFFFAAKIALDFSSKPGAAMHSTKSFATSSAVAASTARLNASTPPNAETGSHASAFKYASSSDACSAVPQGLLCLMITAAGLENSAARLRAASRSTKLLYESSLPWSCFAPASPSGARAAGTYNAAAWCGIFSVSQFLLAPQSKVHAFRQDWLGFQRDVTGSR